MEGSTVGPCKLAVAGWWSQVEHVFSLHEIVLVLGLHTGPLSLCELCYVSSAVCKVASVILPKVTLQCPPLVYVCGGRTDGFDRETVRQSVECFDCRSGRWIPQPAMNQSRQAAAAVVVKNKLYICGGTGKSTNMRQTLFSTVERFDPLKGVWEVMPSLSGPRNMACACASGSVVYICGGSKEGRVLGSVERFDTAACSSWELWPEGMEQERARASAGVLGEFLYVCGGFDEKRAILRSVERFHLASGRTLAAPPMKSRRSGAAAVCVSGRLCLCAGWVWAGGGPSEVVDSFEIFDPVQDAWEVIPQALAIPRGFVAAVSVAGAIYVLGGRDIDGDTRAIVERVTGSQDIHFAPPMAEAREDCMAGALFC